MAPRFPIDEAPDPAARQVMEESLATMHGGAPPFQWIEEDGKSLLGPYAPLCYSPIITRQFWPLAKSCYNPTAVKPRNRELAILGLSSVLDVPYIVYCHRGVAEHVGLTTQQYEDGLAGKVPGGLSEEEAMAYRLGQILTKLTGPLDDATWQEVTSKMDKAEVVGVLHIVAGYRWVALLVSVNGEDRRGA
ncbi:hypothetical protein F4818DRAFT_203130 [Hypoxylon cercidicola]|nr:hypothetical protein F4818DRAFT_203130 [Hypoxylon cercidicola]